MLIKIPKLSRAPTLLHFLFRYKCSLGLWDQNISTDIKLKVEKHWCDEVLENNHENGEKVYILPMFPYPSGNLHMGHVRVYTISDTLARFYKLNGKNVIHPIGWDAFGLPAENAAIERNIPPHKWTESNISTMKKQLTELSYNFDWHRELSTCDPKYYKWTQYIFLKLHEHGLAYQSKANVNWDPIDKTVLADEQVDENGCSWRSGAKVEKRVLTQWFIKTTKFAKDLYDGLSSNYLENWRDIINLQKHWIGECNGVIVTFDITLGDKIKKFDVWSAEPYKFIHGECLCISKNNLIFEELSEHEIKSLKCLNPITGLEVNIYATDDIVYPEGRDTYLVCSLDPKDKYIIENLNICPNKCTKNLLLDKDNEKAVKIAVNKNCGGYFVSSKLKDWLISRQRYWGTPIPIIHCSKCGTVPVPYKDLPIELPLENSNNHNIPTLSNLDSWRNCECPQCGGKAARETDTMDTFVDSSWYYYRFLDPHNNEVPFEKSKLIGTTPVSCYIGGKEHAVLHLYYARFMSHFLHSLGWTPNKEPFKRLLVQGMVMGQSYKIKSSGKYIPPENVEKVGNNYKEKGTDAPVVVQWEKMSKSKYNGENPQRLLTSYGCDTTRLLILADVPPATTRRWSDTTLPGVLNFQHRLWLTIREFLTFRQKSELIQRNITPSEKYIEYERLLRDARNFFTATTTYHFKYTQKLSNNVPAEVIANSKEYELALAHLIIMLSPVTPHFCSELWAGFVSAPERVTKDTILWHNNVLEQDWPVVDRDYGLSFQCKKAVELALSQESVKKRVSRGILRIKYELYPDTRAILHITTKQKVVKAEQEVNVA
ncbi:unnamed protein product [Leptidea sinapis]|uniref:leucine--tRNA ligase n=1 Tax=Leptidea sinapis TaxID=189913 RepID=A0A5E4QUQ7_9NEOP|nr:unnamed protein product [Leptidea sinapis]